MKLLIAGSRSIKEFDLEKYVPVETTMIISDGHSRGTKHTIDHADRLGKRVILIIENDFKQ